MAKKKEQYWAVECTITGRATAYVTAATKEEAIAKAKDMDVEDSDLTSWEFDEVLAAEVND